MYDRIRTLAQAKGLSIPALEEMAGVSQSTIGKWKRVMPKADALYRVACILDTTVDYLLTGKERPATIAGDGRMDEVVTLLLSATPDTIDVVAKILTLAKQGQSIPGADKDSQ